MIWIILIVGGFMFMVGFITAACLASAHQADLEQELHIRKEIARMGAAVEDRYSN